MNISEWANLSIHHLPTTGAILLYDIIKGEGIEYAPFTTIERAFDWIGLSQNDIQNLMIIK